MNLPSVKTLMRIKGMDKDRAKLLRKVLECESDDGLDRIINDDKKRFAATNDWLSFCHHLHLPYKDQIKLSMANDIIEGFGVEFEGKVDIQVGPPLEYVSLGNTYDRTLCLFRGRYVVSSFGDIVERNERLFRGK